MSMSAAQTQQEEQNVVSARKFITDCLDTSVQIYEMSQELAIKNPTSVIQKLEQYGKLALAKVSPTEFNTWLFVAPKAHGMLQVVPQEEIGKVLVYTEDLVNADSVALSRRNLVFDILREFKNIVLNNCGNAGVISAVIKALAQLLSAVKTVTSLNNAHVFSMICEVMDGASGFDVKNKIAISLVEALFDDYVKADEFTYFARIVLRHNSSPEVEQFISEAFFSRYVQPLVESEWSAVTRGIYPDQLSVVQKVSMVDSANLAPTVSFYKQGDGKNAQESALSSLSEALHGAYDDYEPNVRIDSVLEKSFALISGKGASLFISSASMYRLVTKIASYVVSKAMDSEGLDYGSVLSFVKDRMHWHFHKVVDVNSLMIAIIAQTLPLLRDESMRYAFIATNPLQFTAREYAVLLEGLIASSYFNVNVRSVSLANFALVNAIPSAVLVDGSVQAVLQHITQAFLLNIVQIAHCNVNNLQQLSEVLQIASNMIARCPAGASGIDVLAKFIVPLLWFILQKEYKGCGDKEINKGTVCCEAIQAIIDKSDVKNISDRLQSVIAKLQQLDKKFAPGFFCREPAVVARHAQMQAVIATLQSLSKVMASVPAQSGYAAVMVRDASAASALAVHARGDESEKHSSSDEESEVVQNSVVSGAGPSDNTL